MKNLKNKILIFAILLFSLSIISANVEIGDTPTDIQGVIISKIKKITSFLGLTDTPSSYSGSANLCVKVNSGESGLEFEICGVGGGEGSKWTDNGTFLQPNSSFANDILISGDINITGTLYFGTLNGEANLNVNSSNFWDGLNTPSDINASDITDDGTYLLATGDTATGNYTFDTPTFHIDSSNNRIGIGTITPQNTLNVVGDANITGDIFSNSYQVISYQRTVIIKNVTMTAVI